MNNMTKQIYINTAGALLCIILWFSLAVSILYFTRTIQKIDEIYSLLEEASSIEVTKQ